MKASKELLYDIYREHRAGLPDAFRWEDENDRVNELFYCLVQRLSGKSELDVRRIVTCLAGLGLFDIGTLAEAKLMGGKGERGDKFVSLIHEIFTLNGFEEEIAKICTTSIVEVAKGIQTSYGGKLQRFLRDYGQRMLTDMDKAFAFSQVTSQDEQYILTHWLQNVLELPIPSSNEYVKQYCEEKGIELEDLIRTADEVNVNVAVVDDLLKLHLLEHSGQKGFAPVVA